MGRVLQKLFNLYPGEGRAARSFLILGFLWSFGAFGGLTLSEGMFLEHIGAAKLPESYVLTASIMCLLSSVLLIAIHHLSIPYLLCAILALAAGTDALLYFLLPSLGDTVWIWYLFKACGWIIPIAIYISFWAFIDQYYDLQDAKRCFCLFNSVLYLGDAAGGGLISFTLEKIGIQGCLLLFITSMLLSIPLVLTISKRTKPVHEESHDGNPQRVSASLKQIFLTIVRSPFTQLLMLFYFLMQLIVITTEYSYMDSFGKAFALSGKEHSLTEFLGTLAMWVSLGNMFFGLFFFSRTVTKFGVGNTILIAPIFFLLLFGLWASKEAFFLATLAFIAREGMTYTFDDNNLLLLISGVPTRVKNQVRVAIESFFEPIGMLVSAALLFFLHNHSHELGLVLSIASLVFVLLLRTHYPKAILKNLIAHTIDFEKKAVDWIQGFTKKERSKVETHLLTHLKNGDEESRLLAFEYLIKMDNKEIMLRLLGQFGRFSIKGKLKMIEILFYSNWIDDPQVLDALEKWRKITPHPSIRSQIHFILATKRKIKREAFLPDLNCDHLGLKGSALLSLKMAPENLSQTLFALENLKKWLDSHDPHEICMGLTILGYERRAENIRDLIPFLNHRLKNVAQTAAHAISLCAHPSFTECTDSLIKHISKTNDLTIRTHLLEALKKCVTLNHIVELTTAAASFRLGERKCVEKIICAFGKEALHYLSPLLQDQTLPIKARLLAGKMIGLLSPSDLKAHLISCVNTEIDKAYFYLFHAEKVGEEKNPSLAILENALTATSRAHLDLIVQLVAGLNSTEECEVLGLSLHSKNRKIRAAAIESFEKMSDPTLFALIKPLLDERVSAERIRQYTKRGMKQMPIAQLLDLLEESPSIANRIVSLTLKSELQIATWNQNLQERIHELIETKSI